MNEEQNDTLTLTTKEMNAEMLLFSATVIQLAKSEIEELTVTTDTGAKIQVTIKVLDEVEENDEASN